jgi:hypothetical protein
MARTRGPSSLKAGVQLGASGGHGRISSATTSALGDSAFRKGIKLNSLEIHCQFCWFARPLANMVTAKSTQESTTTPHAAPAAARRRQAVSPNEHANDAKRRKQRKPNRRGGTQAIFRRAT